MARPECPRLLGLMGLTSSRSCDVCRSDEGHRTGRSLAHRVSSLSSASPHNFPASQPSTPQAALRLRTLGALCATVSKVTNPLWESHLPWFLPTPSVLTLTFLHLLRSQAARPLVCLFSHAQPWTVEPLALLRETPWVTFAGHPCTPPLLWVPDPRPLVCPPFMGRPDPYCRRAQS